MILLFLENMHERKNLYDLAICTKTKYIFVFFEISEKN